MSNPKDNFKISIFSKQLELKIFQFFESSEFFDKFTH